jgi:hypothetical protein
MIKKESKLNAAKKVALKNSKKVKKDYSPQSNPQSKVYTEENDAKVSAKPVGYRFTDLGAAKLGKNPKTRPTKAEILQYKNKTFKVKGETQRYLYQEKRVDKSDLRPKNKFADGGTMGAGSYADGGTVGAGSFKKGGATFSGRQYDPYREEIDLERTAKPVGFRYTDKLAKRLGVSEFSRPTAEHIKKYLGRGVYREMREDKSDLRPTTSRTKGSLQDGGTLGAGSFARGGKVTYGSLYERIIKAVMKDIHVNRVMATQIVDKHEGMIIDMIDYHEITSPKEIADAITSDYGEFKKGGATFSGRQYDPYREEIDLERTAKPVGMRYTDKLAKRLGVSEFSRPTPEHIKKYFGRGVYREMREDKADLRPTTSRTKGSLQDGGTLGAGSFARGGKTSYRPQYVRNEDIASITLTSGKVIKNNSIYDGAYVSKSIKLQDGGLNMMARGGGVDRIANSQAREYTENLIPFKGANLVGNTLDNGDYVVLSYGYYPIWWYCKAEGKWYGNSTKYSVTTSKQMTQSRPTYDAVMLSKNDLTDMMMKHNSTFEEGGLLDNILSGSSSAPSQMVGGTSFSQASLTDHLDITNPNF